jgi:hypothetical protein
VPILPVPHSSPERDVEIERQRTNLPPDLLHDSDFVADSPMCNNYYHRHVVLDKRRKAGFLGDKEYNFSWPPRPPTPPPKSTPPWDDNVAYVLHAIQMAQKEGRQIELPEELTEDEMTSLGILISEMPQPVLPRYVIDLMPPGY